MSIYSNRNQRRPPGHVVLLFALLMTAFWLAPAWSAAQGVLSGGRGRVDKFTFLPIPYINFSRSIGFAFGGLPMAMFNLSKQDTLSPSSIAGLLGLYTTNKTWFVMGFSRFYLDKDNWRITAAAGLGSVNFQFYLEPPFSEIIGFNTQADFFYLGVQRRIVGRLYGGVSYTFYHFDTRFDIESDTSRNSINLHAIGLDVYLDLRDNVYYPAKGMLSEIDFNSYPGFLGNDFVSNKIELSHNHYFPIRQEKDVLGARFYGGFGVGDLAFEQQLIVGRSDIRGYTQGEFRGDQLLALQGEYRWNFHPRFGAVVFFGLATVFGSFNESQNGTILPGGGAGFRFTAFQDSHLNVGLDLALGRNDWGFYFRIGEAF